MSTSTAEDALISRVKNKCLRPRLLKHTDLWNTSRKSIIRHCAIVALLLRPDVRFSGRLCLSKASPPVSFPNAPWVSYSYVDESCEAQLEDVVIYTLISASQIFPPIVKRRCQCKARRIRSSRQLSGTENLQFALSVSCFLSPRPFGRPTEILQRSCRADFSSYS